MFRNIIIQTLSHLPLQFKPVLPQGFEGKRIPGSELQLAQGSFGTYLIQQIKDENYCLHYSILDILQPFRVKMQVMANGLFTRFALVEPVVHSLEKSGELKLREGEFGPLPVQPNGFITHYEAKRQYIHVDTFFSKELVDEVSSLFPRTDDLSFAAKPKHADVVTQDLVESIVSCKFNEPLRQHFFNSRVKDLLIQHLVQWNEAEPATSPVTPRETDAVYAAEKIISEDIGLHINIPELARRVHLSEYRFKIVFKIIFGTGAYEYLQKKRLKKAKELLEQGYSVKEVAAEIGYHVSHFITLFRDRFHITPGSIRRNKR
jgi:AraC-like DNA-binding protein